MKNTILILFFLIFFMGCSENKSNNGDTVRKYYNAFDSGNYDKIKVALNDSLIQISGDFVTPYNHESFYELFRWDSIFKSSYKIVELEEKNTDIIVTVAQKIVRNAFLKNNPLVYRVKFSFTADKISKLEDLDYIGVDWDVWNQNKDSLVAWIKNNYPDLDGFVNDLTMKGSKNYLKAIELYTSNKDSLQ